MKGLIIKSPWIDYILKGDKKWEIRGNNTSIRGTILLIKSGTDEVYGECDLVDCIKLNYDEYKSSVDRHCVSKIENNKLPYKNTYAWVLKNVKQYEKPKKYKKKPGAVIWVKVETC